MALWGIAGGLLMLFGDMCFYMVPISGEEFMRTNVMSTIPTNRLILGGMAGPLAGMMYALGAFIFYSVFEHSHKRVAVWIWILFVVMFIVGGAYHSIFTTYGFVDSADTTGMIDKITALIGALRGVSFVAGLIGSILFIYMVLKYNTAFPKWIVIFTPTFWTLLNGPMVPYVPYPLGSVIVGGWINICFTAFFILCYFVVDEKHEGLPLIVTHKE
jgi:hypothetical protein